MGLAALPFVSAKGSGAGYKKMSSTARRWRVAFTWPILLPVSSAVAVATPGSWLLAPALGAGLRRREQQKVLREHGRLEKYGSPSSKIDALVKLLCLSGLLNLVTSDRCGGIAKRRIQYRRFVYVLAALEGFGCIQI